MFLNLDFGWFHASPVTRACHHVCAGRSQSTAAGSQARGSPRLLVLPGIGRQRPVRAVRPAPGARRRSGWRGLRSSPPACARSVIQDGSSASALTPAASSVWVPSAPPINTNFSLVLANSTAAFATATGSFDHASAVGPFSSGLMPSNWVPSRARCGQPVLRDLEGRPRGSHPAPQIGRLGDRQPLVAGDDDHRRVGERRQRARRRTPASPYGPSLVSSLACHPRQCPADARPGCPRIAAGVRRNVDPVRLSLAGTTKASSRAGWHPAPGSNSGIPVSRARALRPINAPGEPAVGRTVSDRFGEACAPPARCVRRCAGAAYLILRVPRSAGWSAGGDRGKRGDVAESGAEVEGVRR